jgi:hypothetical protein
LIGRLIYYTVVVRFYGLPAAVFFSANQMGLVSE